MQETSIARVEFTDNRCKRCFTSFYLHEFLIFFCLQCISTLNLKIVSKINMENDTTGALETNLVINSRSSNVFLILLVQSTLETFTTSLKDDFYVHTFSTAY